MSYDLLEVDRLHFNKLRELVKEEKVNLLYEEFIKSFAYDSIYLEEIIH